MKKIHFIAIIFIIISLYSCRTFYDLGYNIYNNFRPPKEVKKIKNPVKDSIKLSALWIGHSTVLIQIYDKVIITDPFLTNNVAEIQKRLVEPGIDINDVKRCDIILLSHSHFDHTNLGSLGILEKLFPKCKLVFPQGLEEFLPDFSFDFISMKKADEKDRIFFGETINIDGVFITTVAAFHWGGRYGFDGFYWGYDSYTGFMIQYKDKTVYFSGDTAYDSEFFKILGEKYNIDLEFIPIGPCRTCEELHKEYIHAYPKGALEILKDTKAKLLIPIHYGTIYEKSNPDLPVIVLKDILSNKNYFKEKVKILEIGEQIVFY